jgi:hypothetical protein
VKGSKILGVILFSALVAIAETSESQQYRWGGGGSGASGGALDAAAREAILAVAQTRIEAETLNVAAYEQPLSAVQQHSRITNVFTNLRYVSLEHRLPAFESVLANGETIGGGLRSTAAPQERMT